MTSPSLTFRDLGLREEILKAVDDAGYGEPTPIQQQAIPHILARRDVVGIAQTGTGKTAAFVLPMIHILAAGRARARMPRSLILSPTRELATQTSDNFERYGKHVKLSMALLIGGVGMGDQEKALERGVDVLIATPGRLLDWFERGKVMLGGVDILVIDEADRMLDMGFIPDIERIVGLLRRREQTMLFSATMPKEVRRLAEAFLDHPTEIAVAPPATMVAAVEDYLAMVPPTRKLRALRALIGDQNVDKAIVFCNRKRDVSSLNRQLQKIGFNARDIHGDLEQRHRQATLDAFKRGEVDFLIATDVAARGLDIQDMPCVINYDVPLHAEDYVHRIGRTGRAGRKGRAFTFAGPGDDRYVGAIARLIGRPITPIAISGIALAGEAEEPPRRVRPSRRRAEAAPAEPQPAEPQPAAEAKPAAAPRRRRKPEALPAPEAPAAVAPPSGEDPQPVARRGSGGAPRPARSGPPPRPSRAPQLAEAPTPKAPPGRSEGRAEPVVGLGDHVPAFLLRPVPLKSLDKAGDE